MYFYNLFFFPRRNLDTLSISSLTMLSYKPSNVTNSFLNKVISIKSLIQPCQVTASVNEAEAYQVLTSTGNIKRKKQAGI
jgi:hypothetical protein